MIHMNLRFLCGWGYHRWRFVEMGGRKRIDFPGGVTINTCRIKYLCKRCGLVRVDYDADIPKRVKM